MNFSRTEVTAEARHRQEAMVFPHNTVNGERLMVKEWKTIHYEPFSIDFQFIWRKWL